MLTATRPPILAVVQQHQEEAACLRSTRQFLVSAPHVRLHQLRRLDDRIAAHLDGLAVAGAFGSRLCDAALASPGIGEVFAATVRAIEDRNLASLARLLSLAQAGPAAQAGLLSAFGWVSASRLRGISKELLDSRSAFARQVGLAACGLHRVDAGPALGAALQDPDAALRRRALRVVGEQGRVDLLSACVRVLADGETGVDSQTRFDAARSALLLGDRDAAVMALQRLADSPGPHAADADDADDAMGLLLKVVAPARARAILKSLALDPGRVRALIQGVGAAGDVHFVPWLVQQMSDPTLARLAGEAFSTITGLDLAYLDLDTQPPQGVEAGPNDDPDDAGVAMDADDSLPWPDPAKVAAWWQRHGPGFATGTRYFMGEPLAPPNCVAVLKTGFQRQRGAAALHLSLLQPGRALFNTAAPAWRQQRLLAAENI